MLTEPDYELSKNQKLFIKDAKKQGHDIDYGYSGRCMYGRKCPSIIVESPGCFATKAKIVWDNMAMDFVLYAKD